MLWHAVCCFLNVYLSVIHAMKRNPVYRWHRTGISSLQLRFYISLVLWVIYAPYGHGGKYVFHFSCANCVSYKISQWFCCALLWLTSSYIVNTCKYSSSYSSGLFHCSRQFSHYTSEILVKDLDKLKYTKPQQNTAKRKERNVCIVPGKTFTAYYSGYETFDSPYNHWFWAHTRTRVTWDVHFPPLPSIFDRVPQRGYLRHMDPMHFLPCDLIYDIFCLPLNSKRFL